MYTRVKYLKVKIKSLASESKIIRREIHKTSDPDLKTGLRAHAAWDVRNEARYAQLAYAFLRNKPYKLSEAKTRKPVNYDRLEKMVERFGVVPLWNYGGTGYKTHEEIKAAQSVQSKRFLTWKEEALEHIEYSKTGKVNTG